MVSMRGLTIGVLIFMIFVVTYGSFIGMGNSYYSTSVTDESELESYDRIDEVQVDAERLRDDIKLVIGNEKEQSTIVNIISALRGIGRATLDLPILLFDFLELCFSFIDDFMDSVGFPPIISIGVFVGLLLSLIFSIIYGLGGLTKNER